jgi:hypothetical protein
MNVNKNNEGRKDMRNEKWEMMEREIKMKFNFPFFIPPCFKFIKKWRFVKSELNDCESGKRVKN